MRGPYDMIQNITALMSTEPVKGKRRLVGVTLKQIKKKQQGATGDTKQIRQFRGVRNS